MKVTPQIPTRRILCPKQQQNAGGALHLKDILRSAGVAKRSSPRPGAGCPCPAARVPLPVLTGGRGRQRLSRAGPCCPAVARRTPLCPALSCHALPAGHGSSPDPRPTPRPSVGAADHGGVWPARRDQGDARSGRVPGRPPPFTGLLKLLQHGERQTRRGHPWPGPLPAASLRPAECAPTAPPPQALSPRGALRRPHLSRGAPGWRDPSGTDPGAGEAGYNRRDRVSRSVPRASGWCREPKPPPPPPHSLAAAPPRAPRRAPRGGAAAGGSGVRAARCPACRGRGAGQVGRCRPLGLRGPRAEASVVPPARDRSVVVRPLTVCVPCTHTVSAVVGLA